MVKSNLPPPAEGGATVHSLFPDLQKRPVSSTFGGSDGGNSMLEERVRRLEEDVKEVKLDMKVVRSDLAELKGKVSMLPGYPGITMIVTLVGALIVIAQKIIPNLPPTP